MWDKNTSARLCTKKAGGAYAEGGGVFAGHYSTCTGEEDKGGSGGWEGTCVNIYLKVSLKSLFPL